MAIVKFQSIYPISIGTRLAPESQLHFSTSFLDCHSSLDTTRVRGHTVLWLSTIRTRTDLCPVVGRIVRCWLHVLI